MTSHYPVLPAPDGLPAFDYRTPSPLLQRGIQRLAEISSDSSPSRIEPSDNPIELLWIFEPRAQFGGMGDIEVVGEIAYIVTELAFFALNDLSGEELWSYHVPPDLLHLWPGDHDGVDPSESGSLAPWLSSSDYSVRPAEGIVYLRKGDSLISFDAITGIERWSFSPRVSGWEEWVRDDIPYDSLVAIASDDGYHVLDARNGEIRWQYANRPLKWVALEGCILLWDHIDNLSG